MKDSESDDFVPLLQAVKDLTHQLNVLEIDLSIRRESAQACAQTDETAPHSPDTWQITLSPAERAALIEMQFVGSALAMAHRQDPHSMQPNVYVKALDRISCLASLPSNPD